MLADLLALADPGPGHAVAALAAFAAGVVRGFSGFGTALVFIPATAAAISPIFAAVAVQVMDSLPALPLLVRAVRIANWRLILPIVISAMATLPLGVLALKTVDPVPLRWIVSAVILALVAVLWTGWRMPRPARGPEIAGIGGLAGLLSGMAGMAGPPVILFYLAGQSNAAEVRASLIVFLGAMTVSAFIAFALAGLFTLHIALWGVILMAPYSAGLLLGSRLFSRSNEATFRRAAFAIILGAVIVSLPLFDGLYE